MVQTRLSVFTRRCGRLRIRLRRERSRRSYVSRMARKSSPKMVGRLRSRHRPCLTRRRSYRPRSSGIAKCWKSWPSTRSFISYMTLFTTYTVEEVIDIHTTVLQLSHEEKMDGILNRGNLELAVEAPLLRVLTKRFTKTRFARLALLCTSSRHFIHS